MLKRISDVIVAALGLVLTSPLMAAIALALRIEGRGPVVHRSQRLGQGGRVFHLVRFRTMIEVSPGLSPEARLTPVGRFIRNYSLDDLPSLVQVLRGDLSLIGPRPMEVGRVDPTSATWQRLLSVRPGYVSYAILQLGACYNTSTSVEKERLELEYVARQSFRFDLSLLVAELWALLTSRGNIKARGKPAD